MRMYCPSLKENVEATITDGKRVRSKGGSFRNVIYGEYEGRKCLPKTVKADVFAQHGFSAEFHLKDDMTEGIGDDVIAVHNDEGKRVGMVALANKKNLNRDDDVDVKVTYPVSPPFYTGMLKDEITLIGENAYDIRRAESKFDKLSKEIAEEYEEKGKSPEEAQEIGDATAAKIGRMKYGKRKFDKMGKKAEFTPEELTKSSAIHGDFDTASINYSGHQNLMVRAEDDWQTNDEFWEMLEREYGELFDEDGYIQMTNSELRKIAKEKGFDAEAVPIGNVDDDGLLAVVNDIGDHKGFIELEDDEEEDSIEIEITDTEMNEIAEIKLGAETVAFESFGGKWAKPRVIDEVTVTEISPAWSYKIEYKGKEAKLTQMYGYNKKMWNVEFADDSWFDKWVGKRGEYVTYRTLPREQQEQSLRDFRRLVDKYEAGDSPSRNVFESEAYDEMLNDMGVSVIQGYDASRLLRETDPIAYEVGMRDYESALLEDYQDDPTMYSEMFDEDEELTPEGERMLKEMYDDMLDESGIETLAENYNVSRLLKETDPIAYRVGLSDFESFESEGEYPQEFLDEFYDFDSNPTADMQDEETIAIAYRAWLHSKENQDEDYDAESCEVCAEYRILDAEGYCSECQHHAEYYETRSQEDAFFSESEIIPSKLSKNGKMALGLTALGLGFAMIKADKIADWFNKR